jgi:hypothetical protein
LFLFFKDAKKCVVYPAPARSGFRLNATANTNSRGVIGQQDQARNEQKAKTVAMKAKQEQEKIFVLDVTRD